ncbi:MAG: hypothetical protein WCS37_12295 [Chloroflexota bacterium]|nr:hypothetical protein [Chloroflexota bacterium]
MRTIEMRATVDEQGKMLLELPSDVPQGEYQIVMVFADSRVASLTAEPARRPKPPLKVHMIEWDIMPENTTFGREELYDDVEYCTR